MRLKELHYVMYGEDDGRQTPYGEDMPSFLEIAEKHAEWETEFPNYTNFEFECDYIYRKFGNRSYQWYLTGMDRTEVDKVYPPLTDEERENVLDIIQNLRNKK